MVEQWICGRVEVRGVCVWGGWGWNWNEEGEDVVRMYFMRGVKKKKKEKTNQQVKENELFWAFPVLK